MSIAFPIPRGTRLIVPDYVSDGVTLAYPYNFYLVNALDLYVGAVLPGETGFTQLTLGADYSLSGVGAAGGGNVNLLRSWPSGTIFRVKGLRTPNRTTSVVNDGSLQTDAFEQELDAVELTCQEMRRDIDALQDASGDPSIVPSTRAAVNDADYPVKVTDRMVGFITLSADRLVTLPLAALMPPGIAGAVFVQDESGNASLAKLINFSPSGADTIAGVPAGDTRLISIGSAYGGRLLIPNSINLWTYM